MNRFQILASVLLSTSTVLWAAPKQDTESWIDASVKAKSELLAKLKEAGMPVISQWVKHKQKAQPFSVDVKGLEKLVYRFFYLLEFCFSKKLCIQTTFN